MKPAPTHGRPEFVSAATLEAGDVPAAVASAMKEAERDGRRLVVYVGASWCEPCRRFHEAVDGGELDAVLRGVRFLEFDADVHTEQLEAAGFGGRLVPRFAVPGADGRGRGTQIEGGVKGGDAVAHIMERLTPMLSSTANDSAAK